jgi:hypothetical protein
MAFALEGFMARKLGEDVMDKGRGQSNEARRSKQSLEWGTRSREKQSARRKQC